MEIDEAGKAHICEILRKNLYSDPILSVIREISCNAVDAHVEAKKRIPIKVTIPTFENPNFVVRDFGAGLSHDRMNDTFGNYGASTKRNSNKLIGQYGIGSKSPFAISDSYSVISYYEGKKRTYSAVINKNGIGELILLNEMDSSDPSGLEVIVPVSDHDFYNFQRKAVAFFQFWKNKPEINIQIPVLEIGINTDNYSTFKGNSVVLMGNIAYPLDTNELKLDHGFGAIFSANWIFKVKIGEVDISASRESLRYTEKTIEVLKEKIEIIFNEYKDKITQEIENSPNLREAKQKWRNLKMNDLFFNRSNIQLSYKGEPLVDSNFHILYDYYKVSVANKDENGLEKLEDIDVQCWELEQYYISHSKLKRHSVGVISCSEPVLYYRYDDKTKYLKRRLENVDEESILIATISRGTLDQFITKSKLQDFEFKHIDSVEPAPLEKSTTREYDVMHSAKVFKYNLNPASNSTQFSRHDFSPVKTDLDQPAVYLEIDRFMPTHGMKSFDQFKLVYGGPIYAVKTSKVNKLTDKWVRYDQFLLEYLKQLKSEITDEQIADFHFKSSAISYGVEDRNLYISEALKKDLKAKHPLYFCDQNDKNLLNSDPINIKCKMLIDNQVMKPKLSSNQQSIVENLELIECVLSGHVRFDRESQEKFFKKVLI